MLNGSVFFIELQALGPQLLLNVVLEEGACQHHVLGNMGAPNPAIVPCADVSHMYHLELSVIVKEIILLVLNVKLLPHIDGYYYHHDAEDVICNEMSL